MLVLTRRQGESILLDLNADVDPSMTVGDLFDDGPIEVVLLGTRGEQARIGFDAPQAAHVLRDELVG